MVSDIDLGIYLHIVAQDDSFPDVGKSTQIDVLSHFQVGGLERRLLDATLERFEVILVKFQQGGERGVRILHPDHRSRYGSRRHEVFRDDDHRSARGVDEMSVLRIGQEGNGTLGSLLDFGQTIHADRSVSFDGALKDFADL